MSIEKRYRPMHERLFSPAIEGGPSPKHLVQMLKVLCYKKGHIYPDDLNEKDQYSIAKYIQSMFTSEEIDWAHRERVEFYKNQNRVTLPKVPKPIAPEIKDFPFGETVTYDTREIREEIITNNDNTNNDNTNNDNTNNDNTNNDDTSQEEKRKKYKEQFKPSDDDEKYVLRVDYDNDIDAQAELFFNIEKNIASQKKEVDRKFSGIDLYNKNTSAVLSDHDRRLRALEISAPTIVTVNHRELEPIEVGLAHNKFPLLVQSSNARLRDGTRLNIWLYGPAGTGKTYAATQLAKANFGDQYMATVWTEEVAREFKSRFNQDWQGHDYNGSLATQFQVFGYMDANGKYVSTAFRRMWEYGGVYLFDEIDGSMPDALLALQGALSSDYASFPDGLVKRHRDCVILAGANTTGMGGGIEYVGAMRQNSAFLNRWVWLEWPHDNALEDALCADKKWIRRVRTIRQGLEREQIRSHLVTMRQSLQGEALLAAGVNWDDVERMVLRGSLNSSQWERVSR